jgi:SAM-dependent methyltransferase
VVGVSEFSYAADRRHHGRIVRCRRCGHGFVHPLSIPDPVGLYSEIEDHFYLRSEEQRRRTFNEFLDLKEAFVPERGRLLDVGCYVGLCLEEARRRGYSVEGTELSGWAVDIARAKGLTVHRLSLAQSDRLEGHYDGIVAFDVLEHLTSPYEALVAIRRLLRPGGCFFATVPDMGMWHTRLLGERHWLVMLMHLHYFVRGSLARLLDRVGFSRVRMVPAPPYRVSLDDAIGIAEYNALVRLPLLLAKWILPRIGIRELSLRASLFVAAWK